MCLWLLFGCLLGSDPLEGGAWWQYRDHLNRALEARKAQQAQPFLSEIKTAHQLNPDHLMSRLLLAVAELQHGSGEAAYTHLEQVAEMGLFINLENPNFLGIGKYGDLDALKRHFQQNRTARGQASRFATLAKPAAFPEGIAYDPAGDRLFLGSIHQRQIWVRSAGGEWQAFVSPGAHSLWSVLGLAVDAQRGWLWACSAALPQTKGLAKDELGQAALFAFNLTDGKLEKRLLAPPGKERALGDLVIHRDGSLFVTDGKSGSVFRVRPQADRLELWLEDERLRSTQGICLDSQGNSLFLADYAHGLFAVDCTTKRMRRLAKPAKLCLLGMDGLVRTGNDLIAIQNGIRPNRVMRLTLDSKQQRIVKGQVLVANHPTFDEPTLGTIIGNKFVFVANSQWSKYGADHQPLSMDQLADIELLAVELSPAH